MASPSSLEALDLTCKALEEIRVKLRPFLEVLSEADGEEDVDADAVALARVVVALSLGTLRYMGERLRLTPCVNGKDGTRKELNRMRQVLLQVQKKAASSAESESGKKREKDDSGPSTKKQKV